MRRVYEGRTKYFFKIAYEHGKVKNLRIVIFIFETICMYFYCYSIISLGYTR